MANATQAYEQAMAYQTAHYDDNRAPALMAGIITTMLLSIAAFCLRCYSQKLVGKAKEADTWLLLAGLIFSVGSSASTIIGIAYGLGKHQLRVKDEDPNAPWNTVRIFETQFALQFLQAVALLFIKLGVLKYFARAFTMRQPVFRWSIYIATAYSIFVALGTVVLFIKMCSPIRIYWLSAWEANGMPTPFPLAGSCLPYNYRFVVPIAADLLSDVAILLLPLIGLWQLQMSKRRKAGLLFAFSLGALVCVTNVLRIHAITETVHAYDLTGDEVDSCVWTVIQCSVGVIAASAPAIAPLYRHVFLRPEKPKVSHRSEGLWFGSEAQTQSGWQRGGSGSEEAEDLTMLSHMEQAESVGKKSIWTPY